MDGDGGGLTMWIYSMPLSFAPKMAKGIDFFYESFTTAKEITGHDNLTEVP